MISMAARKLPLAAAFLVAAALMQAPDAVLSAVHLSGSPFASSISEVCSRIPPACAIFARGLLLVLPSRAIGCYSQQLVCEIIAVQPWCVRQNRRCWCSVS